MLTKRIYQQSNLIKAIIANSTNLIIIKRHLTSFNSNHSASKTTLTVVTKSHLVLKRTMRRYVRQIINNTPNLISRSNGSTTKVRSYATYSLNEKDANSADPKAMTNNPLVGKKKISHKEIHRVRCNQIGCTGKFCIGLCGNAVDQKAIGHATHGQSPAHETDKKTVNAIKGKDFNGNKKDQNLVIYDDAHNVSKTPMDIKGTTEINTNPNIQKLIQQHEDKK